MTSLRARIALPIALALALVGSMSGVTTATSPWLAGCSQQMNSQYLCVFSDASFKGYLGHVTQSVSNYSNQNYPNSTYTINDTVSSMMNLYSSYDVVWYQDAGQQGGSVCAPPDYGYSSLNIWYNDALSSHLIAVGGTC